MESIERFFIQLAKKLLKFFAPIVVVLLAFEGLKNATQNPTYGGDPKVMGLLFFAVLVVAYFGLKAMKNNLRL